MVGRERVGGGPGAGRADAVRTLYDRHVVEVYRYVHRRCRDRALAEDITQDVFLSLARTTDAPDELGVGWLKRVARNRLIDVVRRDDRHRTRLRLIGAAPDADDHGVSVADRLQMEAALDALAPNTIESTTETERSPQRRWLLAGAALLALLALIGLAITGRDDDTPPAVQTESEAVGVLREYVSAAMFGEPLDAQHLLASQRVLITDIHGLSAQGFFSFVRRLSPELQSIECVGLDSDNAACLVDYVDDWARAIDGRSLTLFTARVEDGLITEFTDLVSNDDALTAAFFEDYMPTLQPEAWAGCSSRDCLASLPPLYPADYAQSEYFVPRTELTLPEPVG